MGQGERDRDCKAPIDLDQHEGLNDHMRKFETLERLAVALAVPVETFFMARDDAKHQPVSTKKDLNDD